MMNRHSKISTRIKDAATERRNAIVNKKELIYFLLHCNFCSIRANISQFMFCCLVYLLFLHISIQEGGPTLTTIVTIMMLRHKAADAGHG